MKRINTSVSLNLQMKAEELLKIRSEKNPSSQSEADMLKLIHELDVHQIELELQNKELLKAQNKVEAVNKSYTELFNFTPACYFKLSNEGEIIDLNLSGAHILGKEPNLLKKSKFGFFVSDDSKPTFYLFLKKLFSSRSKQSCEIALLQDNNLTIYVYLIGLVNKNGRQCIVSLIDITERKQAEEKLKIALNELTIANEEILFQDQERKKREEELVKINLELEQLIQLNHDKNLFLSILAHDIKTPFSVILGYSELLIESIHKIDIHKVENFAKEIHQSTQQVFSLLDDLLKWARIQSGKITFEPKKLRFSDISEDIVEIYKPLAQTKNIAVSYSGADDITVFADVDMLKVILRNLISNAIRYSVTNGKINISAVEYSDNVKISVTDNGNGIASERIPDLFDISKRHTTRDLAGEKGTGLGLVLCKEFAEKHGGRIWVESEQGKGSVFSFTIPKKFESIEEITVSDSDDKNRIINLKTLIVDDNESIRMILGEMVRKFSHEILYAESGDKAIDVFRNNPDIDLILMDYNMPGIDGYEATRIIRQINKNVIIIVETADTFSKVTEEFSGVVINDYFPKPFNRLYLNQLMLKHFNRTDIR